MNYDVDHFINKFSGIPDSKWVSGKFGEGDPGAPHCALGHCSEATDVNGVYKTTGDTEEGHALSHLFATIGTMVPSVNDNRNPKYQQSTPKERILAALNDIKNAQASKQLAKAVPASKASTATAEGYIITEPELKQQELIQAGGLS